MWRKYIGWNGEIHSIREWSEITGLRREVIYRRLNSGLSMDKVFEKSNSTGTVRESICWNCKNSVPNGKYGCSWSRCFKPVIGWKAIDAPIIINDYSKNLKERKVKSYCVCECPQFIMDVREKKAKREGI